jgi:kumamolisin
MKGNVMTATKPVSGSALDGYRGSDGSQHVNFIGVDNRVDKLHNAPAPAASTITSPQSRSQERKTSPAKKTSAKVPDRSGNYVPLAGSERRPGPSARLLGPADEAETLTVTITVRRRPDGPPVPHFDYYRRTPPSERRRLSQKEFSDRYGAEPADIEKVEEFARSHGLTVVDTNAARRTVVVSGTVAQFNEAFGIELGRYDHLVRQSRGEPPFTETYRGRDGEVHIPEDLDGIVLGVFGLDNRRITKRGGSPDPPNTNTITVPEVTTLYDFPPNFAAGQTIAILSETGYALSDLHEYNTTLPSTFSVPDPTDITVRGPGNTGFDPYGEITQDISIAGAAARGASMAVYFTTYDQVGWVDLLLRVVHPDPGDPQCSVLSTSFYVSNGDDAAEIAREAGVSIAWINAVSAALQDMAIQGVTFCTVSGDYGVNCSAYGGAPSDGVQHVVYPGSDPWALCCGGTTIGNVVGNTCDEWNWNDPAPGSSWGTTGGGVSDFFNFLPSYQVDAHVPVSLKDGHTGRGVPDVAADASYNSGYQIIHNGAPAVGNGTSAAAPLWAGLIAILNAALGESVGFVNAVIYALNGAGFRDIVAPPGPLTNGNGGVPGYPAGPGWDACTGWGSPKGVALLNALKHFYGPAIAVSLQEDLHFGTVCQGPAYRVIHVYNVGNRDLMILSVQRVAGSSDFTVLSTPTTPLAIAPGAQVDFTVVFDPTSAGVLELATIQIVSNDPVTPVLDVQAQGRGGAGALETVVADQGAFGDNCVDAHRDEPLTLHNNGPCNLTVSGLTSSSPDFVLPAVSSYPLVIVPGASIALPIRFQPSGIGAFSATITVNSSDPAGPKHVQVSGTTPAGKVAVTGSAIFGAVPACCHVERTISICNVGDCQLHVASVAFKRKSRHWRLVNNPFPATLRPGSCLGVTIRYIATERLPHPCELVITSDDPKDPVKTLEVVAVTVWEDCCTKCCDDCRRQSCEKQHREPCRCRKCGDDRDEEVEVEE